MTVERRGYVDGLWGQVHYRRRGDGPTLVLLHQTPWSSIQFHRAAPLLAAAGLDVIALDTPGYGLSDPPPSRPTIDAYADNVAHVLKGLALTDVAVLGHHTGALIAASLAARTTLSTRLILDNAPCYTPQERAQRQALPHLTHPPVEGGAHFAQRWAFLRGIVDPDMSDASLHLAVATYYSNTPGADHGHAAAYEWDLPGVLPAIRARTLVLSSRGDPIHAHGARILARRPDWRGAELTTGSASVLEHAGDWVRPVLDFIRT